MITKWRVLKVEADSVFASDCQRDKDALNSVVKGGRGLVIGGGVVTTETYYGEVEPVFSPYAAQLRNEIRGVRAELASVALQNADLCRQRDYAEATAASMQKAANAKQEEINALKAELGNARASNVRMNLELGACQKELRELQKGVVKDGTSWYRCADVSPAEFLTLLQFSEADAPQSEVARLDKRITDLAGRVIALEGYRETDQPQWANESQKLERVVKWLKRGFPGQTSEL